MKIFYLLLLITSISTSQNIHLVKNITENNPLENNTSHNIGFIYNPISEVKFKNKIYFEDGINPNGIYVTDGTTEETGLFLKEVIPYKMMATENNIFFLNKDKKELWISDGTSNGSKKVKTLDILNPNIYYPFIVHNKFYFIYEDTILGEKLWTSDGTEQGTNIVTDLNYPNGLSINELMPNGSNGFFVFKNNKIFLSDGTENGTILYNDIVDYQSQSNYITKKVFFNEQLYLLEQNSETNPSTLKLIKINPNNAPSEIKFDSNSLGYLNYNTFNDVQNKKYYFIVNGSSSKKLMRYDFVSSTLSTIYNLPTTLNNYSVNKIDLFNNRLIILLENNRKKEIWNYNLSNTSFSLVKQFDPTNYDYNMTFKIIGDNIYFKAYTQANNLELWKSDGTPIGTSLVKDIRPGINSSFEITGSTVNNIDTALLELNNNLIFRANNGSGFELWKSDGTELGTQMIKDVSKVKNVYIDGNFVAKTSEKFYFISSFLNNLYQNNDSELKLYETQGTEETTIIVEETKHLNLNLNIFECFKQINDKFYFLNKDKNLYCFNLTTRVLNLIKDNIDHDIYNSNNLFESFQNNLYFKKNGSIWKTDGSVQNTINITNQQYYKLVFTNNGIYHLKVETINNQYGYYIHKLNTNFQNDQIINTNPLSTQNEFVNFKINENLCYMYLGYLNTYNSSTNTSEVLIPVGGNRFYNHFATYSIISIIPQNSSNELQIWRTNGTLQGTYLLKNIYKSINNSSTPTFFENNNKLYIGFGFNLFVCDGTVQGTNVVLDLNVIDSNTPEVSKMAFLSNDDFYFVTTYNKLYESNGTDVGTKFISNYSDEYAINAFNDELYLEACEYEKKLKHNDIIYENGLFKLSHCTNSLKITSRNNINFSYNEEKQNFPIDTDCHCDVYNDLICTIEKSGSNPIATSIASKVIIDTVPQETYLKRHYDIYSDENAMSSTSRLTLYYTQDEFNEFNQRYPDTRIPSNPTDEIAKSNLVISKFNGTSLSGKIATYANFSEEIDPEDNSIIWNENLKRWEVTFDSSSLGGFFLKTKGDYIQPISNPNLIAILYPNPVENILKIDLTNTENGYLKIIDLQGRIISEQMLQKNNEVDVSKLSSNIYILEINNNIETKQYKIIKK